MQTKLTEEQIENLRLARNGISAGIPWFSIGQAEDFWNQAVECLDNKIKHGTSDGKPYIEPEPVIPEGYRKALDSEHCRKDVKLWDKDKKQWSERLFPSQPFLNGDRYIVPIDPPLTDEDAKERPWVMVRDQNHERWQGPAKLLAATEGLPAPFIARCGGFLVWAQARRATPEEIEAANGNS